MTEKCARSIAVDPRLTRTRATRLASAAVLLEERALDAHELEPHPLKASYYTTCTSYVAFQESREYKMTCTNRFLCEFVESRASSSWFTLLCLSFVRPCVAPWPVGDLAPYGIVS